MKPDLKVDLVYRKDGVVAVNKPAGMDVLGKPSRGYPRLVDVVGEGLPLSRVVNRIDRDTTGLLFFTESRAVGSVIKVLFQGTQDGNQRRKIYAAMCKGHPEWDEIIEDSPLKSPNNGKWQECATRLKVLERRDDGTSLIEAELVSHGRTHQIRKHMKLQGFPILGDNVYNKSCSHHRMMLHSWKCWLDAVGEWIVAPSEEFGLDGTSFGHWIVPALTPAEIKAWAEAPTNDYRSKRRPEGSTWQEWQSAIGAPVSRRVDTPPWKWVPAN